MNKGIKHTGTAFIAVAILTILFHSVIPHHHHTDTIYSHFDKNCNASNHNPEGEDNATHCHAFNELAIDKTSHSPAFNPDVYALQNVIVEIPEPLCIFRKTTFINDQRKSIYAFLFRLLRAPPENIQSA